MRAFRIVAADFFYLLPFLRYKGPKRAKIRFLWPHQIFIFSSNFDVIFFIGFLSMRAVRIVTANFFYLLPFLRYKGPKRPKMRFWGLHKIFISHPILMRFFSLDSSQWELSELFSQIFVSLTVLEIQKAQKTKNSIFNGT